ncbi:MAG: hypothetical protein U0V72_11830 [Cytophagales bacterium]
MDSTTISKYFKDNNFRSTNIKQDSLNNDNKIITKYIKKYFFKYDFDSYSDTINYELIFNFKKETNLIEMHMPQFNSSKYGKKFLDFLNSSSQELKDSISKALYVNVCKENEFINFFENNCLYKLNEIDIIKYYSFHSRFPKGKLKKEFDKEVFFSQNEKNWKKVFQIKEDSDILNSNLDSLKQRLLPIINARESGSSAFCGFRPHHFLRIYDQNKYLIGEMDICFECGDLEFFSFQFNMKCMDFKNCVPRLGNTNYFSDKILVSLMKKAGIKNFGNINEY